jgi:hypothetical protein
MLFGGVHRRARFCLYTSGKVAQEIIAAGAISITVMATPSDQTIGHFLDDDKSHDGLRR